jgi:penicillin-binding protein 1A
MPSRLRRKPQAAPGAGRRRLAALGAAGAAALVFGAYVYFTSGLPSPGTLQDYHPNLVTKVYSDDGRIIGEFYIERRVVVPLNRVPGHLIEAFLAAEDRDFFEHKGISYLSIFRAFYRNVMAGKVVQGGSTITQQVAKSFFLTPERTIARKIREAILAYRIERHLSKEEILNLYLNQIYFGHGSYGVQTAADTYFGKDVSDLTIAEAALLASLPKAPNRYSPYTDYALAKGRQEYILGRMLEEDFITADEAGESLGQRLKLRPRKTDTLWVGPYFTEHVRRYIEDKYGSDVLYRGGLEVHTTMHVEMQQAANDAVNRGLREYDKRNGYKGPVRNLATAEEIEAFKAESEKLLAESRPEASKVYQAVITSVNVKDSTLQATLGKRTGVVSAEDLEWARLYYNPTRTPDGGKAEALKRIFHAGDVIEVMVKEPPKDAGAPLQLSLEQEPEAQGALVALEPSTGRVRAMVGGSDFSKTQFNRAVQAMRQPGSSFKPVIYAAALDRGYTPATVVLDSPLVFEEEDRKGKAVDAAENEEKQAWRPRNFDEQFYGPTTIREALAKSRNVVTIKVLKDIGVEHAVNEARLLGITSPLARDLSLALGSSAVTLMEMTTAYSTFENLGVKAEPMFVTKITDRQGNVLEENHPTLTSVISPQTAYLMTSLLQGVIENGTGARARSLGRPAAGKTGTTNDLNDAWFIGYVPGLAAGAWVGHDSEKALGGHETGAVAALPVWLRFMKDALEDAPQRDFAVPDGVEFTKIDPSTGLLAGALTQGAIFEVFKAGTAPSAAAVKAAPRAAEFFMMDAEGAPGKAQSPAQGGPADAGAARE